MKRIFILCFCLIHGFIFSQVTDDFSDGNFSVNPAWSGDTADFEINSYGQLHLEGSGADTSVLVYAITSDTSTEWHFWIKLSFNTSANNYARVYLLSDQQNLKQSLNGYFLQFGNSSDEVSLNRQTGFVITELLKDTSLHTAGSTNQARFRITRNHQGKWMLYADPSGLENYSFGGNCLDNSFRFPGFSGVYCKYTSSNSSKFYFDDFYTGRILVDSIRPEIKSFDILNPDHADVYFSEAVEKISAEKCSHYFVDQQIDNPDSARIDPENKSLIHLHFRKSFQQEHYYNLTVNGINDIMGNPCTDTVLHFAWYVPRVFDVLINEILADPDPPAGLPDAEFIELFNRSSYPVSLKNWILEFGNYSKRFGAVTMLPDSFLILCKGDTYKMFGNYIGLFTSSSSLSNDGGTVSLRNAEGKIIHAVSYSNDWYENDIKKEGGWSLEMKDVANPCGCGDNWTASADPGGGTPGKKNSVVQENPDLKSPEAERIAIINAHTIQVFFNEPMDSTTLMDSSSYLFDHELGHPIRIQPVPPSFSSVKLTLKKDIEPSVICNLNLPGFMKDCAQNLLSENKPVRFALPDTVKEGDLLINEVLSDPREGGVMFTELFNPTDKVLDMGMLCLSSFDTVTGLPKNMKSVAPAGFLFFPGDYKVFSKSGNKVRQQYLSGDESEFIDMPDYPSFRQSDDHVVLMRSYDGLNIDHMQYNSTMHFPLLLTTEGVSLERISMERPGMDKQNWHSAAETSGFATPAQRNSVFYEFPMLDEGIVTISPEVFSPDNDGRDDVVMIRIIPGGPDYLATIRIFDSRGIFIKYLVKNVLTGENNLFSWDGTDENRKLAETGIYVMYVELFNPSGSVKKIKRTVVLSRRN